MRTLITVGVLLLVACVVIIMLLPLTSNPGQEAGAVLGLAGIVALGIERVLEFFWRAIDSTVGKLWPLGLISGQITKLKAELDVTLDAFCPKAEEVINRLKDAEELAGEKLTSAQENLEIIKQNVADLKALTPGDSKVEVITASLEQAIDYLEKLSPGVIGGLAIGRQTLEGVSGLLAKFKDNPGRQFISVYIGVVLALLTAAFFGIDLFQAILGDSPLPPSVGIALTGLVLGLGSDPMHQFIRLLEEAKRRFKSINP